jgi:hypothetical protein
MGNFKTVNEAKEYFRQIRKEQLEIIHLGKMIEREELTLLPKAIRYDTDKVQLSPDDILVRSAAEIADMKEELQRSIVVLKEKKAKAESVLMNLDNSDEREVMRWYYMDSDGSRLLKWEDVAEKMNYNKRWVLKIHGRALSNLIKK